MAAASVLSVSNIFADVDFVETTCKSAKNSITRALCDYGVTEEQNLPPTCTFSPESLAKAFSDVQKHLESASFSPSADADRKRIKVAWVYCNTPQEVTMLAYLVKQYAIEHLYVGVSVHVATTGRGSPRVSSSTCDDVAATCAAVDLLLTELESHFSLKSLRLNVNVLAPYCPFGTPEFRCFESESVVGALHRLHASFGKLLARNHSLKKLKVGLHKKLFELFPITPLYSKSTRADARLAFLLGSHDRVGQRSNVQLLPIEVLEDVLDLALPLDQTAEVLPLST